MIKFWLVGVLMCSSIASMGSEVPDSISEAATLDEYVVTARPNSKLKGTPDNVDLISGLELTRAACCNLGESFTTNPSVDVSYSDASTGARQIRLLGLSGTYVQMLTENVPNFRGAASPFGLGYIPGPWMQSISVSKGASSVKNGYESITGQINIEMLKPQTDQQISLNGYLDHKLKAELNAMGNIHLTDKWSTGLLLHGENAFMGHDDNNDGFLDSPRIRQLSVMNRWAYFSNNYIFQAAAKYLGEKRIGGQESIHSHANSKTSNESPLYKIDITTHRGELFTKNAYIFDSDNDGNIALILSGSYHSQDALYGIKYYDVAQSNFYASLMLERKWNEIHQLSTGLSFNYDHYRQHYLVDLEEKDARDKEIEGVSGLYAQYTLNLDSKFIAMAGLRYDYSSVYGSLFTPRVHLRYNPSDYFSFHASAGKGYRTVHPLAELNYLLASSRKLIFIGNIPQESAWNYGIGGTWTPGFWDRRLSLSAEYYFTDFRDQMIVSFDIDPHAVYIYGLHGKSRSHTFQTEISLRILDDLNFMAAYRLTDVKADYGRGMQRQPLVSRSKGLFTIGWTPDMSKWQFDASLAINGGGRMPQPYEMDDGILSWQPSFKTYCTLNAQITRNFRHWSVYLGGENLTGYTQKNAVIGSYDPWGPTFDSTMIYGPLHGAVIYVGFRYNFTKYI